MARLHVLLGPYESRTDAAATASALASEGYDASRPRVARLRDRTGPSVAARLADRVAVLEAQNTDRCHDINEHHANIGVLEIAIAELRTEHAALVVRVGELEMLPAPVRPEPGSVAEDPTPEQIEAYLRGSAEWSRRDDGLSGPSSYYWHGGARGVWLGGSDCFAVIAKHEGVTPAEMRERILAASSGTAEDPDRLAKRDGTRPAATPSEAEAPTRFLAVQEHDDRATRWTSAVVLDATSLPDALAEAARRDDEEDTMSITVYAISSEHEVETRSGLARKARAEARAEAARNEEAKAKMVTELREAGWIQIPGTLSWGSAWGKIVEGLTYAHAAMRATKGAPPDLFEALKRSLEPSLAEKETFLRSKGWTNEEPYGWHCPGIEGTLDTHKAYALAKGAR